MLFFPNAQQPTAQKMQAGRAIRCIFCSAIAPQKDAASIPHAALCSPWHSSERKPYHLVTRPTSSHFFASPLSHEWQNHNVSVILFVGTDCKSALSFRIKASSLWAAIFPHFCHSDEGGISAILATCYNCFACSLTLESSFLWMISLICFYFLRKFALYLCAQVSDAINHVSTILHHRHWNSRFIILCNISNQLDVFWGCSATTAYDID